MKWYYSLWADAIGFEKAKHGHFRDWKPYVLAGITVAQGLNFAIVILAISVRFDSISFFFYIDFLPGNMLDYAISGFITLFLPFGVFNYFMVYHQKQYESIVKNYRYRNGKLYKAYLFGSMLLVVVPVVIALGINRLF